VSSGARSAVGGEHDVADPGGAEVVFDGGFAVAPVGGDRSGSAAGAGLDALDGGFQHRGVGRVAGLDGVVEDHAVFVVDELGLVAELDGRADRALADRSGVRVMHRHDPSRRLGKVTSESLCALFGHLHHTTSHRLQAIHGHPVLSFGSSARLAESAARVAGHGPGLMCHGPGDDHDLGVDPPDVVCLVVGAATQAGVDRPAPAAG
jgi:hypothetical protein